MCLLFIQVGQNCLFRMPNITRIFRNLQLRFMKIIFWSTLCVADMSFFLGTRQTHIVLGKVGTKKRLWEPLVIFKLRELNFHIQTSRKGENCGACDKDRSKCVHHLLEIFTHSTNSVNQECVMIHTSEFSASFHWLTQVQFFQIFLR